MRPQEVSATPRFYRPELDALRFFAFTLVFWDHVGAAFFPVAPSVLLGAFGVSIFFCLSAYLIVTLLIKEIEATGTIRVRAFAARRVLRIWPLYFLVVGAGYLIGRAIPAAHLSGHGVLALSLLAGNVYVAAHSWPILGAISPLWSISVEEQFYLAVPFLTKIGGRRSVVAMCSLAIVASYLAIALINRHHPDPMLGFWPNSIVEFQFFGAGGLVALLLYERKLRLSRILRYSAIPIGVALFYSAARWCGIRGFAPPPTGSVMAGYAMVLFGTVLILVATVGADVRVPKFVLYLGRISYGLYVFHGPVLWLFAYSHFFQHRAFSILATGACTLLLAAASYRFFETPFLRLKSRFETVKTRPIEPLSIEHDDGPNVEAGAVLQA